MEKKLIEWTLDDLETTGVRRISLVTTAATDTEFMLFGASNDLKFKVTDTDKRVLTGVAMRPDLKIARYDENGDLYYGFFSKDTVVQACQSFFKNGQNINNTNVEHEHEISDVYVYESWIVEDVETDKTKYLGFSDIKNGDWIVTMKVDNDVVWEDFLKSGELKGFSVEIKAYANDVTDLHDEIFAYIQSLFDTDLTDEDIYSKVEEKLKSINL